MDAAGADDAPMTREIWWPKAPPPAVGITLEWPRLSSTEAHGDRVDAAGAEDAQDRGVHGSRTPQDYGLAEGAHVRGQDHVPLAPMPREVLVCTQIYGRPRPPADWLEAAAWPCWTASG